MTWSNKNLHKKPNYPPPWGVNISKSWINLPGKCWGYFIPTWSPSSAPTLVTQMQLLSKIYMLQRLKLRRKKFKRGKRMSSGNSHLRGALKHSLSMDTFGAVFLGNDWRSRRRNRRRGGGSGSGRVFPRQKGCGRQGGERGVERHGGDFGPLPRGNQRWKRGASSNNRNVPFNAAAHGNNVV